MSWHRFFDQLQKDLKLWVSGVVLLELWRVIFILHFRRQLETATGWTDILATLLSGLRYDAMVVTYWILLPLLASVVCGWVNWTSFAAKLRNTIATLYVAFTTLLCAVSIGYFAEYDDIFNESLFGIYYDDTGAILQTLVSEYHLIPVLLGVLGFVLVVQFAVRRFLRQGFIPEATVRRFLPSWPRRTLVSAAALVFLIVAIRGSIGPRPAQRRDAGITTDPVLNKAVINPYSALRYAIKDHQRVMHAVGIQVYLPDGDVRKAAQRAFSTDAVYGDLDTYLRRHARGPKTFAPRHIFLILAESYDTWPLLDQYRSLQLAGNLRDLAERGIWTPDFLPAADGTMTSLAAIITGLADAGVHTNFQNAARSPLPSSIAPIFRRLGYRTRLFYGGYLTWQRIGDFALAQGFEEVYGAAHIGRWSSTNEWGVDDQYLFDYILSMAPDSVPSFSLVLTSTYHPPYDIDVRGEGFPLTEVPADLDSLWDGTVDLTTLAHLWYTDRCLGDFVRDMEQRLTHPLVAITGDHSARRFINAKPTFFEKSAVPFVLYGPEILDGLDSEKGNVGSHLDIGPTLIELAAPGGFVYHALGRDLLSATIHPLGIARGKVIGPNFLADVGENVYYYPASQNVLPDALPDTLELRQRHDAIHGIAWWRIMRGPLFPQKDG